MHICAKFIVIKIKNRPEIQGGKKVKLNIMNQHELIDNLKSRRSIVCSFCNSSLANSRDTVKYFKGDINSLGITTGETYNLVQVNLEKKEPHFIDENAPESYLIVEYVDCPACGKIGIKVYRPFSDETFNISPRAVRKNYPDYIPLQIRQDYEEACLIADLSPKASATLSRRCIQGMIRDFFGISKSRLVDEIDAVKEKTEITPNQIAALKALKDIGNIGAHPERDIELIVDVEPNEAKLMITLIEYFMEQWYIRRHTDEEMMNEIVNVSQKKKELKRSLRVEKKQK